MARILEATDWLDEGLVTNAILDSVSERRKLAAHLSVSQRTFAVEGPLPFRDATSWDERRLREAPFRRD
jgi:hypothetical protein